MCSLTFKKVFKSLKLTHIQEAISVSILKDELNSTVTFQESNEKQTLLFSPTLI